MLQYNSSSAAGLLGRPCHPGWELVWIKSGIPWLALKKKNVTVQL